MRLLLALALLAAAPAATAQISSDRPGFTYGTSIVPAGRVQVEMGLPDVVYSSGDGLALTLAAFSALGRVGLTSRAELQLGVAPLSLVRTRADGIGSASAWEAELSSVYVSGKYLLRSGDVAVAVQPELSLPVGEGAVTAGAVLAVETEWANGLQAGASGGVSVTDGAATVPLSTYLGRDLAPGLNLFGELAAYVEDGTFDGPWLGLGLGYAPSARTVLDASVQHRVGEAAWGYGVGLSVQF